MKNEIIKDFGQWSLPTGWNELTLKQYQELEKVYSKENIDIRGVLEALSEHSKDEIDQLPIEFIQMLLEKLLWVYEMPQWGEPTNKVEIDGVSYYVNIQNKLKTGEFIAVDTVIKSNPHNYAAIMAILCRKEGELYDSKFENEILEDRIKMWEQQPIIKIIPVVNFFLQCYLISEIPTQLCLELEEAIDHIAQNIENSEKIGVFKRHSMILQIKKLKKSLKSIKNT